MARRNTVVRDVTLNQPDSIVFTDAERKSEFLKVAIRITNRPPQVGTFNQEPTIPRKWSGWYWLLHRNNVVDAGAVQFENQLLLRSQLVWIFEQAVNTYSIEATTPDTDANELIDENAVLNYYSNEQDPDNYYLPFPHPYDEIKLWFPPGVTTNVIVEHTPWSPISVFGEDNDLEVAQFIQEREELTQPSLGTNTQLPLDDVCEIAFPENWVSDTPRTYVCNYEAVDLTGGGGYGGSNRIQRSFTFESRTPPGTVGVPQNGTGTFPASSRYPAGSGVLACPGNTPVVASDVGSVNVGGWSRQLIETQQGQHYLIQTAGFPTAIDLDSVSFTRC